MPNDLEVQTRQNDDGTVQYLDYKYKGSKVKVQFSSDAKKNLIGLTIPQFLNISHTDVLKTITAMFIQNINEPAKTVKEPVVYNYASDTPNFFPFVMAADYIDFFNVSNVLMWNSGLYWLELLQLNGQVQFDRDTKFQIFPSNAVQIPNLGQVGVIAAKFCPANTTVDFEFKASESRAVYGDGLRAMIPLNTTVNVFNVFAYFRVYNYTTGEYYAYYT